MPHSRLYLLRRETADKGDADSEPLLSLSQTLEKQIRKIDALARLSRSEFAIMLPHTDQVFAQTIARRHRAAVNKAHWNGSMRTVSIGVATNGPGETDPDEMIARAEEALSKAKKTGDKVVAYTNQGSRLE